MLWCIDRSSSSCSTRIHDCCNTLLYHLFFEMHGMSASPDIGILRVGSIHNLFLKSTFAFRILGVLAKLNLVNLERMHNSLQRWWFHGTYLFSVSKVQPMQ